MPIELRIATLDDVAELVAMRQANNDRLVEQYGEGYWAYKPTEKGALYEMRNGSVYIGRIDGRIAASLTLAKKKPWAIDKSYFKPSKLPLYLTSMAVSPDHQRTGVGRMCIEAARQIAAEWPADAIRLDAFDAPAGAGEFYRKCGFEEVGRVTYRTVPLIYFEMLI